MNPREVYDRSRFVPGFVAWLQETATSLELPEAERGWITSACERLNQPLLAAKEALNQARDLEELAPLRAEWVGACHQAWIDALERLQAGFVLHGGPRSPLAETVFGSVKLAALRRARAEALTDFAADFWRRARSTYVARQLALESHSELTPLLKEVQSREEAWQSGRDAPILEGESAELVRQSIAGAGEDLERVIVQARLLVEAALLGAPGGTERLREIPRLRRRS